jgi:hypothetical protein
MSDVFQNIDPHPLSARRVCNPPPSVREEDTPAGSRLRGGGGGGGVNILEDARHCSILRIRKYFVLRNLASCLLHYALTMPCKMSLNEGGIPEKDYWDHQSYGVKKYLLTLWQYSRKKLVHVTLFSKHRKNEGSI